MNEEPRTRGERRERRRRKRRKMGVSGASVRRLQNIIARKSGEAARRQGRPRSGR